MVSSVKDIYTANFIHIIKVEACIQSGKVGSSCSQQSPTCPSESLERESYIFLYISIFIHNEDLYIACHACMVIKK